MNEVNNFVPEPFEIIYPEVKQEVSDEFMLEPCQQPDNFSILSSGIDDHVVVKTEVEAENWPEVNDSKTTESKAAPLVGSVRRRCVGRRRNTPSKTKDLQAVLQWSLDAANKDHGKHLEPCQQPDNFSILSSGIDDHVVVKTEVEAENWPEVNDSKTTESKAAPLVGSVRRRCVGRRRNTPSKTKDLQAVLQWSLDAANKDHGKHVRCTVNAFANKTAASVKHSTYDSSNCFSCSMCAATFKQRAYLNRHFRKHTGESPFLCALCPSKFYKKDHLVTHMRIHTGERPYACTACSLKFSNKSHLSIHIRTHTGEKPFQCLVCPARFTHSSSLENHVRTHTGEKPYSCALCSGSFSQKGHLRNHIRAHMGDKPFSCSFCSSSFQRKDHLRTHIRTHTGQKPYSCALCTAAFSDSSALKRHVGIHTNERAFSCPMCSANFRRKGNLSRHILTHTGEKHFPCSLCPAKFVIKSKLTNHLYSHMSQSFSVSLNRLSEQTCV